MSFSFMFGRYGIAEIFLFLTRLKLSIFYRSSTWPTLDLAMVVPAPSDQQELMDTGCNRLVMVTQDIFSWLAAF
jgi:hypothetical protein